MPEIVTTADGSHTLYVPEMNEHYHSVHGAVQESDFIFIRNGFDACHAEPLNILEIGFGTGLNAFLTALRSINGIRTVNYTTIEKYPLDKEITEALNYHQYTGTKTRELFRLIHSCPWNERISVNKNFTIKKIHADFTRFCPEGMFDLIYFDAFGPDKQPEMWTSMIFSAIASVTGEKGIFITYSAKGQVKRNLKMCGFDVTLLPGPPGKRQIIRADKKTK